MTAHPIEQKSFEMMAERVKLDGWPPGSREVVSRVVHATGDPDLVKTMVVPQGAVNKAVEALNAGAPVVCDVEMVASGIRSELSPRSWLESATATANGYPTRSQQAIRKAAIANPLGAVFVIGCAPTALEELCDLIESGAVRPAVVIGTPVGFVGAAESKDRLRKVADACGIPAISNIGDRGGSAIASSIVNAIYKMAIERPAKSSHVPALFLIGHGTRSEVGVEQFNSFADAVRSARPGIPVGSGLIEFAEPDLATGIDALVSGGSSRVIAVPVVLLGAGHMKDDGPAALRRAREDHRGVDFSYARDIGVDPIVLAVTEERIREAGGRESDAVVLVGRGSSDPDANSDLSKIARLLADRRGLGTGGDSSKDLGIVEPAFVSLAAPDVRSALDKCEKLGAKSITVGLYFLFTGVLPERVLDQATDWATEHREIDVRVASVLGPDERIAELIWTRYDESVSGNSTMNCDTCFHRVALPGYENGVGKPIS